MNFDQSLNLVAQADSVICPSCGSEINTRKLSWTNSLFFKPVGYTEGAGPQYVIQCPKCEKGIEIDK